MIEPITVDVAEELRVAIGRVLRAEDPDKHGRSEVWQLRSVFAKWCRERAGKCFCGSHLAEHMQ